MTYLSDQGLEPKEDLLYVTSKLFFLVRIRTRTYYVVTSKHDVALSPVAGTAII